MNKRLLQIKIEELRSNALSGDRSLKEKTISSPYRGGLSIHLFTIPPLAINYLHITVSYVQLIIRLIFKLLHNLMITAFFRHMQYGGTHRCSRCIYIYSNLYDAYLLLIFCLLVFSNSRQTYLEEHFIFHVLGKKMLNTDQITGCVPSIGYQTVFQVFRLRIIHI